MKKKVTRYMKSLTAIVLMVSMLLPGSILNAYAGQTDLLADDRQVLNFNTNWLFVDEDDDRAKESDYDETKAEKVSLPHSLGEYDIFQPDPSEWQKITWYRRHFSVSAEEEGNRVIVYFDGGGQINNVYVNGAYVGTAKGTFTDFSFDITDYITFGEYDNVLAVEVDSNYHRDTLPPSNDDFHWMGGLHGDARMEIVNPLFIESVFYWTEKIGTATYVEGNPVTLKGKIQVVNLYDTAYPVTLKTELKDQEGNVAATGTVQLQIDAGASTMAEVSLKVKNPKLWNTDTPYLYQVITELQSNGVKLDSTEIRTGLRWITSTGKTAKNTALTAADDQQILLNDQPLTLYGINKNQQFSYIGNSGTEKLYEKDAYTLKYDLGVNFVRTAHYSQDPDFFEACDEVGILVEEEALAWNAMPEVARPQFVASIESMVKRDRNHPSIIFWSIMPNEGTEANYPVNERQQIQKMVKELDHTRLTIQEENHEDYTFVTDVYANHDYVVSTSQTPVKVIKRQPYVIGEWNDNLGRVFVSPYDSEARKIRQVTDDGKKLEAFMQDKTIDGFVKWDFNGYLTSLNNYKWGKTHGIYRVSGVYGPFKDPLVRYWEADMMKVQTDSSIVGNVVKIMNEWKSDSPEEVYVAANAPFVELWKERANGERVSLGKIAPNYLTGLWQGLFLWENVEWEAGSKLIAVSFDQNGKALAEDIRYASSYDVPKDAQYALLNATKNEYQSEHYDVYGKEGVAGNLKLQADGSDLAVLMGVLQDANGQKLDYAYENTTFEILSGPGKLITGPRVYMLGGVNSAYLQSEYGKTGNTVVQASVDIGTMVNQDAPSVNYSASGWTTVKNISGSYQGDYAKSTAQGAWVEFTFTGTQAVLYSHLEYSGYGTGTVTVDGKAAGSINFRRGEDKVGVLDFLPIFETEVLEAGEHTIRITAGSSSAIAVDALKVFDGVADVVFDTLTITTEAMTEAEVSCHTEYEDAPMQEMVSVGEIEALAADAAQYDLEQYAASKALAVKQAMRYAQEVLERELPSQEALKTSRTLLQKALGDLENVTTEILYTSTSDNEGGTSGFYCYEQTAGTWVAGNAASGELYANKKRTPGDFVSLCFEGTGIRLYGKQDSNHGIARIILTNQQNQVIYDKKIDMYSDTENIGVLLYENLALEEGTYVIKVMVTGETSGNPSNACVGVCSATVYRDGTGAAVDRSSLKEKLDAMKQADISSYDQTVQKAYAEALEDAQYLAEHPLATAEEIEQGLALLGDAEKLLEIPEEKTPVTELFGDLKSGSWYVDAVQYVYDKGLMSGNDGLFNPTGSITRVQVIMTLYRLEGMPEVTDYRACTELLDVAAGKWYTDAICWAYNEGVATGNSETKRFDVNTPVKRQQLAAFFYRYAQYQGLDTSAVGDISGMVNANQVSSYAKDAVKWAVGVGLISGSESVDSAGNKVFDLKPAGTATRAQMATILKRFCENYKL